MPAALLPALADLIFQVGTHQPGGMNERCSMLLGEQIKSAHDQFRLHGAGARLTCFTCKQDIAADDTRLQMPKLLKPILDGCFGPDIQVHSR